MLKPDPDDLDKCSIHNKALIERLEVRMVSEITLDAAFIKQY